MAKAQMNMEVKEKEVVTVVKTEVPKAVALELTLEEARDLCLLAGCTSGPYLSMRANLSHIYAALYCIVHAHKAEFAELPVPECQDLQIVLTEVRRIAEKIKRGTF